MLRSELYELEKSIGAIIDENSTADKNDYQQQIAKRVAYVQTLCSELRKKWTHELLSSAKEQVIKRYIQYHQAGIIQLSDQVTAKVSTIRISTDLSAFQTEAFSQVMLELENILKFLRSQFYQYFDIDHKATFYNCHLLRVRISELEIELVSNDNRSIDKSLIAVVLKSVNEIAEEGEFSGVSQRQVDHCINAARMTYQLLFFGADTSTDDLVIALYQQNFNSLHFYNWYRHRFLKLTADISDKKAKQSFIDGQVSKLAGIFVSPEKTIQPELPSTDVYLIPWLETQLGSGTKRDTNKVSVEQFPLNLSVPQFALFIRIFSKTGCFPIDNVAVITRFFSTHFTTKKQPHISPKSFGRAFYNLDQPAAAVVRDFLQKMLNYLNKTYFP